MLSITNVLNSCLSVARASIASKTSFDDVANGINLDKEQILVIQFEALYVGSVQIGLQLGMSVVWLAVFDNANNTATPPPIPAIAAVPQFVI